MLTALEAGSVVVIQPTLASFHEGRAPHNKGLRYPPDPPTVEEIISVMRAAGDEADGVQAPRAHHRAVACRPSHKRSARTRRDRPRSRPRRDPRAPRQGRQTPRGRNGPLGVGKAAAVDRAAQELARRSVLLHPARIHARPPLPPSGIRAQLHRTAASAGVRRRFAPHQLRHAHAVEMSREGVPLVVIQRQLGHADLGVTSAYLRGIDNTEIIHTVHERPIPMIPATARLAPDA